MYRGICQRCKGPVTYVINRPTLAPPSLAPYVEPERGRWTHDAAPRHDHPVVATEVTPA